MKNRIINNFSLHKNHSSRIKYLFEKSTDILIVSPFIMPNQANFFRDLNISDLSKLQIVTTLIPRSNDQLNKIKSFKSLFSILENKNKNIDCQISIDNKLHGKIYIFKCDKAYLSAIISSANFTYNGLIRNHEWGVEIFDHKEINKIEKSILDNIDIKNLSKEKIKEMSLIVDNYLTNNTENEEIYNHLNLLSSIYSLNTIEIDNHGINYWLKPIGASDDPVDEDRLFISINEDLHFSTIKPSGVKINDIIIAYGVGVTKILSIYKVSSQPKYVSRRDIMMNRRLKRWPWYVSAINLTTYYGSTWKHYDLFINRLKDDYLHINPNGTITAVGGRTTGGLNWSKDKLRLTPEFANFIINEVNRLDQQVI